MSQTNPHTFLRLTQLDTLQPEINNNSCHTRIQKTQSQTQSKTRLNGV